MPVHKSAVIRDAIVIMSRTTNTATFIGDNPVAVPANREIPGQTVQEVALPATQAVRVAARPMAAPEAALETAPRTAAVLPGKPLVPALWIPMTTDITPSMKMMIMIGTATGAMTTMLQA